MNEELLSDKAKSECKPSSLFLKCSITLTALCILGASGFFYFNLYLSEGSGPAGPSVPEEPFKKIWSDRSVLLVGLGDSITAGFGASEGLSYFDRLVKNPPQDGKDMLDKSLSVVFPNIKTRNLSMSGSNSLHHLKQVQKLEQQPPDVLGIVVITTGGNDLIHSYGQTPPKEGAMYGATLSQAKPWIDNFEKRLDQMITDIKQKFPGGCQIFIANIYDPSDGTGNTNNFFTGLPPWPDGLSILKAYNEITSQCAYKYDNVHLVSIHDTFLGHGIHCKKFWLKHYCFSDPHYWYYLNIEDPSERGYDAIRRLYLNEIIKVFYKPSQVQNSNSSLKAVLKS